MKHAVWSPVFATLLCIGFGLSCTSQLDSDETSAAHWYKGNLHTHSYWSDGDEFPEMIMAWYKMHDYQFIALSDHNVLAVGEKWIHVQAETVYQEAFRAYLDKYGPEWVEYREDSTGISVRLKTFEEYKPLFDAEGEFLILQSEEISDSYETLPLHLNATNIQENIEPQGGNSVLEVLQNNINAVIAQRDSTGVPMIPHVNHPNFGYAVDLEDMIALTGERFFEVYNGHPLVHNSGDSTHISTEEMWDLINIAYLQSNKPLMYGLATDDSHNYHEQGRKMSNAGRGWIMVQADTLSPEALIAAMEAGHFYASTGVVLNKVVYLERTLSVEVAAEAAVSYQIAFIGCREGSSEPEVLKTLEGDRADFALTDDMLFVRCKIVSSKLHDNPVEDLIYEMAWTQPVVPSGRF